MNERLKPNSAGWQPIAAAACFLCAVLSLAIGFVLTTGWLLDAQLHPFLHGIGVFLLIVGIPILILGGHFMDLRERKIKQSRSDHQDNKQVHVILGLIVFISIVSVSSVSVNAQQSSAGQTIPISDVTVSQTGLDGAHEANAPIASSDLVSSNQSQEMSRQLGPRGVTLNFGKCTFHDLVGRAETVEEEHTQQSNPKWQYGGFVDLAYPLNFNHPENRLFRSRGTAFRTDGVWLNMAGFYVRKRPSEESRWGVEATVHAGKDAEFFGFSATAPNIAGYKFLRQLGPTNVSYLAPVGKGLTLQAGIFSSFIGYDSLYAKDNLNYTRPWGADFTPYLMWGANASYPLTEKFTGTFFVVNGYWHLARANSTPSVGGQVAYKINPRWTAKQTLLIGPHQRNTAFKFWRFLSNTIVERRTDRTIFAFDTNFSTERIGEPLGPRAWWFAAQLPTRWIINNRWSVSVRPEVAWDSEGRWTLSKQTVKAFTSTLEYRVPHKWTTTILRMEHRWDDSRGPQGGFFRGREISPGVVGLTPSQHLLIFATMFTFDSPAPQ